MSVLSKIGRFAAELRASRSRMRAERLLQSLPKEIQKDIGWPDCWPPVSARHFQE